MSAEIQPIRTWEKKLPLLLALAALMAYWNSFAGAFFLDDHVCIVKNAQIGNPFSFFLGTRVLASMSLTLNYWLDGINPRGYHVFNLAIHTLAGLTLYGVVGRTLILPCWGERLRRRAPLFAFAVALLWLVHPLNTQAVTYVIQRCESMAGLFYLLTLYAVIRGATGSRTRLWYAAAGLSCLAGCFCKEVTWTAPAVILAYDWVFLSPSLGQRVRRRWGLYVVLASGPLIGIGLTVASGFLTSKNTAISFRFPAFGPWDYALTQCGVILYYLRLSVWPSPLCLDYLDWPISRSLAECWPSAAALALLLLGSAVAVARRHWIGFLSTWFFLILAPSSSILPIQDPVFEHRMYLSLAAMVVLVVAGLYWFLDGAAVRQAISGRSARGVAVLLVGVWTVTLAGLTMKRNADYCNFIVMSHDIAALRPLNYRALETYAQVLLFEGKPDEALEDLRTAARVKPAYFLTYNTAGRCFLRLGRVDDAVRMFQTAVDLKPAYEADVYPANLGRAFLLRGDAAAALRQIDVAILRKPANARYHVLRAVVLTRIGRDREAEAEFDKAVDLDPSLPRALDAEARAAVFDPEVNPVALREQVAMAEAACSMSYEREPQYLDTLAEAYAAAGRFDEAQETCAKAIRRADASGMSDLAEQMRGRLELYRNRRPYTEDAVR